MLPDARGGGHWQRTAEGVKNNQIQLKVDKNYCESRKTVFINSSWRSISISIGFWQMGVYEVTISPS